MMTNNAPELLPCPFCGGKNVKAGHGVRYAECLNCDSMGPTARYPDNAISAWNTRADAEVIKAAEALAEQCETAFDNVDGGAPPAFYNALDAYRQAHARAEKGDK